MAARTRYVLISAPGTRISILVDLGEAVGGVMILIAAVRDSNP